MLSHHSQHEVVVVSSAEYPGKQPEDNLIIKSDTSQFVAVSPLLSDAFNSINLVQTSSKCQNTLKTKGDSILLIQIRCI